MRGATGIACAFTAPWRLWARCALDYANSLRLGKGKALALLAASPLPMGSLPVEGGSTAAQRAAQTQTATNVAQTVQPDAASEAIETAVNSAHGAANAADAAMSTSYVAPPEYSWSGYFMGLAVLFIMLAMLWGGARFLKNKGALRFLGMSDHVRVESRLSLGPKKNLLVLNYNGKRLLLGVTDHHITLLDSTAVENSGQDEAQTAPEAAPAMSKTSNFMDILHGFAKK